MNLRHWLGVGFGMVLGWLGCFMFPVQAEVLPINLVVDAEIAPTFASLLQQAELTAESAVSKTFMQQPGVTEIIVNVVGERYGRIVTILVANVTRADWQTTPHIRIWSRNLRTPALLLGFDSPRLAQGPGQVPSFVRRRAENDPAYRDD
jgi:hypothetical protein